MIQLTCQCCGYTQSYGDADAAHHAGWDCPPHFRHTACPVCPGVCAIGLDTHHKAHEHWQTHGRPEQFDATCVGDKDWGCTDHEYAAMIRTGRQQTIRLLKEFLGVCDDPDMKAQVERRLAELIAEEDAA